MRIFTFFLVLALCGSTTANLRFRRAGANFTVPEIKEQLTTAAQVFTTLGDIKSAQNFAERYLEIKPTRMITALKGVSIAASMSTAFTDIPDPGTKKILNNINNKFDTMFKKMDSQTVELKSYIDQNLLNTFVLAPVKTAVDGLDTYRKKQNAVNKAAFLEKAKKAKLPEVIKRILLNARDVLTDIMITSRYNKTKVQAMSTLLIHNFHKAFVVDDFRDGLELKGKMLAERMETHGESFLSAMREYKKISDEVFENLDTSFFPGFIEEDIIKPAIDMQGDNCQKADTISKQLSVSYPWRQYVAIVSDKGRDFGYYGFPKRSIVLNPSNGKIVLVFMTTKDFKKTKSDYAVAMEKENILSTLQKSAVFLNLSTILSEARNASSYYQIAGLTANYCVRANNTNVYEEIKGKYIAAIAPGQALRRDISLVTIF